ncbi:MAG: hypothetical protein SFU56_12085 [Capsulimonadales bacterium]|nr:hypothetical protein [Capsulimonadales bacterium]
MKHVGIAISWLCLTLSSACVHGQTQNPTTKPTDPSEVRQMLDKGIDVLPKDALFTVPVGGLERTGAKQAALALTGEVFTRALRVTIGRASAESNVTQLTVNNTVPIRKGETLVASFALRGKRPDGKTPAEMMFLFERSTDPWTKSISQNVTAPRDGVTWRRVSLAFAAAEEYAPGQAMVSLRFAFGPQTLEVADLKVVSVGTGRTVDELQRLSAELNPLGKATVTVNPTVRKQVMAGFGGNYCQARYGSTEKIDAIGQYTLDNLQVAVARVGLPLNYWAPQKGVYREEAQAKAAFELLQELKKRKIPVIASVWEGPDWLLPGEREATGKVLSPYRYDDCIETIVRFLVTARDKYQAPVDYFSFNEADFGVNFKFSAQEIVAFLRKAAVRFKAEGLSTRFLIGDTANGGNLAGYAAPLLADKELAPYLGPIAFHSWDALSANENAYTAIADLGRKYGKPVWCTEAGHDAQLWQQPNPWASHENALRLSAAYARTIQLSGAATMLYWTYQDNYPLLNREATRPYPALAAIRMMESVFPSGATVVGTTADHEALSAVATLGPNGKGTKLLLVNRGGAGQVTVRGLRSNAKATLVTLGEPGANATLAPGGPDFVLALPSRSVTVLSLESSE